MATSAPTKGTSPPPNSATKRPQPPAGLKALIDHYQSFYPDQPNPMQVTTLVKFWLGGLDPLDYISMYYYSGDVERGIPAHWHYVSFGLSDLHGDGRVHQQNCNEFSTRSGMGFELTFRLLVPEEVEGQQGTSSKPETIPRPPTWPANLLQQLARYCFQSGNSLCVGDNIPWRKSLDGSANSQLCSILIAEDQQLGSITTPFGTVDFCQIVGVTEEELEQAARWNGRGVLNYLRQDIKTGGDWLVTNMERTLSVFQLFPETLLNLKDDLEKQGSDLAGIAANFTFREVSTEQQHIKQEIDSKTLNEQWRASEECSRSQEIQLIKSEEPTNFPQSMSMSYNSLHKSCPLEYQPDIPDCVTLDGIEIVLAPYAAKYLLLAVKDRIRHGRHFTFKAQHLALTLVAESVTGTIVNKSAPYGVLGYWIQVLIPEDLVPRMIETFQQANFNGSEESWQRLEFEWPDKKLKLIIDHPNMPYPPMPF